MRSLTRWLMVAAIASVVAAAPGAARAQSEDPETYGDGYQRGDFGRVRFLDPAATIIRADGEAGKERASLNGPILPADAVLTGNGERAEIQLAGGTFVRIDEKSEIAFTSLPDPDARYRDNVVLQLRSGVVRIHARVASKDEFRVDTPTASVHLLGDGDYRLEVGEDGRTRVLSRRGVAEVVGQDASVLVRGGTRTMVRRGAVPEDPRPHNTFAEDRFDQWVDGRERALNAAAVDQGDDGRGAENVPEEIRPYYGELSAHGRWVWVPEYGYAWYPVDTAPGWRPYWDGGWYFGSNGWFWVSSEPWGWAPYHYGRWNWIASYGWCWFPGSVFGGAWVSWSWGSAYLGWCPLNFWGYPAYIGYPWYGYYDPYCWTFVPYHAVGVHDVPRYAVPVERIRGELPRHAVVKKAPLVSPRKLRDSAEWRERAVRQAAEDRGSRMKPVDKNAVRGPKFTDIEDRIVRRRPKVVSETPGKPQDPGRLRPSPERGARGPAPADRSPGRNRDGGREAPGDRQIGPRDPSGNAATPPRDTAPFPRRILQDPRSTRAPRSREGDRPPADTPRSPVRDDLRRRVREGEVNERVRDLYNRLSRPREATPDTRAKPPDHGSTRERQASPPPRQAAPPRQAPPRQAPSAPRAQPKRESRHR